MHAAIPIVVMVALCLFAAPRAAHSDGQATSPAEHQAQADQVSVLKVEGMT